MVPFTSLEIVALTSFVNKTCAVPLSSKTFSGGQPVSISPTMIDTVLGIAAETYREYVLSYKADGERCFLGFIRYQNIRISFLQYRTGKFEPIDLQLDPMLYNGTLFDVELLPNYNLLIFDCAILNGRRCEKKFYPHRIQLARMCLARQVEHGQKCTVSTTRARESFEYLSAFEDTTLRSGIWYIRVKALFYAAKIADIPKTWIYPIDGFIWTLATAPFHTRRSTHKNNVLKWKPPEHITVDFFMTEYDETKYDSPTIPGVHGKYRTFKGNYRLLSNQNNQLIWFSTLFANPGLPSGIYECSWTNNTWQIEKPRSDKTEANYITTVIQTVRNIDDHITLTDLSPTS